MPSEWANVVRGSLPRQRRDLLGIAEQEAQHVEMVHAHVGERQPVVVLQKALPVRDRVHVDLREDDLAELAAVEDLLEHAHRLVVAHVLVDREDLAGRRRLVAQLDGLLERQRQRLLRQDRLDVRLLQRVADQRRLLVGRIGDDRRSRPRGPRSAPRACRGPCGMPQRSATLAALARVREAIATTGKPASL